MNIDDLIDSSRRLKSSLYYTANKKSVLYVQKDYRVTQEQKIEIVRKLYIGTLYETPIIRYELRGK